MNKFESLKKIISLLDENLISEEEFKKLKSDIFSEKVVNCNDVDNKNSSPSKPRTDYHSNKKECLNCKILLPIYVKKCANCNYSFVSDIIGDGNINNTIYASENSDAPDKRNRLIFKIVVSVLLIIGCTWLLLYEGNNTNKVQNETENIKLDSSKYNINKDSILINTSNSRVSKDITENNDSLSDENLESKEVNNTISLGSYYHGGIIFYLDYDGKHGLIRTNTIEDENGFTWDLAKQSSEEYINDGYDNWYLPKSEELEMIFADKNENLLKDGKYWSSFSGSENGNFLGYSSSDKSFWVASRDYRVSMAIFISKF